MAFYNRYRGNKYGNHKVKLSGELYDSQAEAIRSEELRALEAAGEIYNLRRQVRFDIIPSQYESQGGIYLRGKNKGQPKRGKLIEHGITYYADFVYTDKNGDTIVEDVKGIETEVFRIKRKLMLYFFGIRVRTVRGGKT